MFHDTIATDERIHDLQTIAAELRAERAVRGSQPARPNALKVRIGTAFMAVGSVLVNGASPARVSPAGR